MLPSYDLLRQRLKMTIANKHQQGYDTTGLGAQLAQIPNDYEALNQFSYLLVDLPFRDTWPYIEPDELEDIWQYCQLPSQEEMDSWQSQVPGDIENRIKVGFKTSLAGCILGKPIEINPTLAQIRQAASHCGQWPINDYISESLLNQLPYRHDSWPETAREHIRFVAPDDDINYTLLGMLILENNGIHFSSNGVREHWLNYLPVHTTFGPERTLLAKAALEAVGENYPAAEWITDWSARLNPGDEYCGALIRADAYGYACPGRPKLAAQLAYKDAHFSHRKTGLYGAMFIAAAIALAPVINSPLEIFQQALRFVPSHSRFYKVVANSLEIVAQGKNWLSVYEQIHEQYQEYCHCQIYQEIGTLINAMHFAQDAGEAICIQVSQGNDTDSFGATCGAIAGMFFGHLEDRWLTPFNDTLYCSLAGFRERSIEVLAQRMARLPTLVNDELTGQRVIETPAKPNIDYEKGI